MRLKFILFSFISLMYVLAKAQVATPDNKEQLFQPGVLIELFSSEGCSSCPIADAFMQEILRISDSTHTPVYVADYHVDIWNRSGWVDPFSDSAYSLRQQTYVFKKNSKAMYTPMAFINGGKEIAGGDKKNIGRAVQEILNAPAKTFLKAGISAKENEDSLMIGYNVWGKMDSCNIVAVLVQREINNMVTGGENANQILHHHNVVKKFVSFPLMDAKGVVKMNVDQNLNLENFRMIVFLQHQRTWDVIAVDQISFKQ